MKLFSIVVVFFLCISNNTSLLAKLFTLTQNKNRVALGYYNSTDQDPWDILHESAFEVPPLLEEARRLKLPVVLLVPDYEGLSPLDNQAPVIEGARVALAWASAYFRFKELYGKENRDQFFL